jgi:hypothetical protein
MRKTALILTIALFGAASAFGHLCNNIYRVPDRVIVKPEKQVVMLERSDEFRVFVQNNYPAYLHNVGLTVRADGEAVKVEVTPQIAPELRAGQRAAFKVKLTLREGAAPQKLAIRFGFSAAEIGFRAVEEPSAEALRALLTTPFNYGDNILAAESLAKRHDPEGTKWLIAFMNNHAVRKDFRSRAMRALGRVGAKENADALKKMLTDEDGFLQGNALLALGCLGEEKATFEKFVSARDDFVRCCASAGSALAGNKDALPELAKGLTSEDAYVRIASGWALATHQNKQGLEVLERAFATKDAMQLVMAGDALVHLADAARQPD